MTTGTVEVQHFQSSVAGIVVFLVVAYAFIFGCFYFLVIKPKAEEEERRNDAWKSHNRALFAAQKKGGRGRGRKGGGGRNRPQQHDAAPDFEPSGDGDDFAINEPYTGGEAPEEPPDFNELFGESYDEARRHDHEYGTLR